MKKTGFTLIELLIVIALLGALAVGLLAAIDPSSRRFTTSRPSLNDVFLYLTKTLGR